MKIVQQIDETHFVVEMQEYDKQKEIEVFIAHDYLSISGPDCFCTNLNITGEYNAGASNCLLNYVNIQIPIRAAQEILKLIKDHSYLKPKHLIDSGGNPNYLWNNRPILFKDENGKWNAAIRGDEETEYSIISSELYHQLKKKT